MIFLSLREHLSFFFPAVLATKALKHKILWWRSGNSELSFEGSGGRLWSWFNIEIGQGVLSQGLHSLNKRSWCKKNVKNRQRETNQQPDCCLIALQKALITWRLFSEMDSNAFKWTGIKGQTYSSSEQLPHSSQHSEPILHQRAALRSWHHSSRTWIIVKQSIHVGEYSLSLMHLYRRSNQSVARWDGSFPILGDY